MNYKVLYRKYRPDSFDSLIGQEHIVSILKNSIKENKIAHAYLFSGPRGTGKTSTARILAKSINCLDNKDGLACGKCAACESFNGNPDIIEIDAASNNGVEEIRELINNVKIMPTSLKYKVYIIDEVHMLSTSAFNALLLTLEEPPEHVIFVLATTNLESVPITIVSRCQRFDFKRIGNKEIIERLKYVCDNEKISYDDDGLSDIADLADGGLRDALSILDQLSKNGEKITTDLVSKEIGSISNKKIRELIEYLDKNDIEAINKIFLEFQNSNLNYKVVIKKIIYVLSDIGSEILNGDNKWHLSFSQVKNLVFDLNNLINKININVDAYLLIKMTFLGYLNIAKNKDLENVNTPLEIKPKTDIKEEKNTEIASSKNTTVEKPKEIKNTTEEVKVENNHFTKVEKNIDLDKINKLVDTRINNCFVEVSMSDKKDFIAKWDTFVKTVPTAFIKGLVSDTNVAAASSKYAIIVSTIKHKELEINAKLTEIEELFNKVNNTDYKLIFISEAKWQEEAKKYNKNNKYTYISEDDLTKEEENGLASVADIFDINKIEYE